VQPHPPQTLTGSQVKAIKPATKHTHTPTDTDTLVDGHQTAHEPDSLTQHPEEPAQQADEQQLPDLLQALLGGGQEAAMGQLLEELLSAERTHRSLTYHSPIEY